MKQRKEELLREVQAEQAKVAALTKQRNIQIQKGKGRKASKTEVVVIPTESKLASHVISPAASHVISPAGSHVMSSAAPTNQMLPQQMFASHQMQEALKVLQQDQQQTITQKAPGDKGPETTTRKSQKSSTKRKQKLLSSDLDIGQLQQLVIVPQQPGSQDSKVTAMSTVEQMTSVPTAEQPPTEMRRGSISRELDLLLQAAVSEEGNINLQEHKIIVTKQEDEEGMSQVPVVEVTPELADHDEAPLQIHITPEQSFEENQIHRFISPATIKSQQGEQGAQEQPIQGKLQDHDCHALTHTT